MAQPKGSTNKIKKSSSFLYVGLEFTRLRRRFLAVTGQELSGVLIIQAEIDWLYGKSIEALDFYEHTAKKVFETELANGVSIRVSWYRAAKAGREQWNRQYRPNNIGKEFTWNAESWERAHKYRPKNRLISPSLL